MALVALVDCIVAAATYKLAAPAADTDARAAVVPARHVRTTPTAAAFGRTFVRALNRYGASHHDPRRLASPHCVEASQGHYMCAYVLVLRDGTRQCHLMQAKWTPQEPVTVLLAGRAARCGSVRAAVRSLR